MVTTTSFLLSGTNQLPKVLPGGAHGRQRRLIRACVRADSPSPKRTNAAAELAPGKVCFCCTARTSHILLGRLAESSEDDGPPEEHDESSPEGHDEPREGVAIILLVLCQ